MNIDHGNCYNFDLPDECLNADETRDVINALLFDLRRTPLGKTFVLDIAIGPERDSDMPWKNSFQLAPNSRELNFLRESEIRRF